jgi:uncharacterized protein YjbI with pentapeptide repeats/menaquinone-dependent protoporphyrinogen IX oxidase
MGKKVLIAYASVSGSTGEVAEAIGKIVAEEEVTVQVSHIKNVEDVSGYSAVVIGSSIRAGRWLPEAFQFLETHRETLSRVPVAYFTTCLTMVSDTEDSRRTVLAYMEPVQQTAPEIKPVGLGLFAGSFDPQRPSIMQIKDAPQGDYRDWTAIQAWAKEIRPALLADLAALSEPVILRDAVLSYSDLSGLDLSSADLRGADLQETKLSEADLHSSDLSETDLAKADLSHADLRDAGLNWADLNRADMSGANLHKANLIGADLNGANLKQANLSRAILNGANLSGANLSGANLRRADLNWADLRQADLTNANVSYANLSWANLSEAKLSQVVLNQATYNDATEWPEGFAPESHGCILVGRVE